MMQEALAELVKGRSAAPMIRSSGSGPTVVDGDSQLVPRPFSREPDVAFGAWLRQSMEYGVLGERQQGERRHSLAFEIRL